jgi:transposase
VLKPDTEPMRKLQSLVEKRRQLVDEQTAQSNRITSQLKLYFPQVLDWFDELSAPIAAAFLQRWPTLAQLQKEDPAVVRTFFYQHGSRSESRIEQRLREMQAAKPLVHDAAVIEPGVLVVQTLLGVVAALNKGIQALEKAIQEVSTSHPDYGIFSSFPAAGPTMAPRLMAAFGSQRERYGSASQVQSFSGIAPVIQASGRQRWIHFRWASPKFLRQTFHEYAGLSIQRCAWARAFYEQQKAKGKGHHAAVRSLAFKWIRILFRCWQNRQPYHEDLYLAARERRVVPLDRRPVGPRPSSARDDAQPAIPVCGKRRDSRMKSAAEVLKNAIAGA